MFFGKYLVDKKVITSAQLVESVCTQLSTMPSILEVLFNSNQLSPEQFIDILNIHINSDHELSQLLIDKNIINQDEFAQALIEQNKLKKSLTEILTENNIVSASVLGDHVDTYASSYDTLCSSEGELTVSAKAESAESPKAVESAPEAAPTNSGEVQVSAAALESLIELGFSDEEAMAELTGNVAAEPAAAEPVAETIAPVAEESPVESSGETAELRSKYLELFNQKKYKRLLKSLKFIGTCVSKNEDSSTYLSSIYRDFYVLKGAASYADLEQTSSVLTSWEGILENLFKLDQINLQNWLKDNFTNLTSSIELLWNMRCSVEEGNTSGFTGKHSDMIAKADELFKLAA